VAPSCTAWTGAPSRCGHATSLPRYHLPAGVQGARMGVLLSSALDKPWENMAEGGEQRWGRQGVVEAKGQMCAREDFRAVAQRSWHSEGSRCFLLHPATRATGCDEAGRFPLRLAQLSSPPPCCEEEAASHGLQRQLRNHPHPSPCPPRGVTDACLGGGSRCNSGPFVRLQ